MISDWTTHSITSLLFFFFAFASCTRVFCFNPSANVCQYPPLAGYTFEHVATASDLINIFASDYSLHTEESFILFNTTGPSDCVLTPSDLSVGEPLPCTMIGVTASAGITLDLTDYFWSTTADMRLHNLSVEWITGKYGLFTVRNFTYMGCRPASGASKGVRASLYEIYTDVDIEGDFASVEFGYMNMIIDNLSGDIAVGQAPYSHEWVLDDPNIYVRIVSHGDDMNVSINDKVVVVSAVSKTVRITMAENTHGTNRFVADVYDCGVVSVSGDNGGFFGVSLVLTDVGVCVANDGAWRSGASVEVTGSELALMGEKFFPRRLVLSNNSRLTCPATLYIENELVINGDCEAFVSGEIAVKTVRILGGALITHGTSLLFTNYLRVARGNKGSFSLDLPVTVLKAIQPGTLDVHLKELKLWSHSSGIELVFDLSEHQEYVPIAVENLITFSEDIPVNVRFEYGLGVSELQLETFTKAHAGKEYVLLKYEKDVPLKGRLVFNYYVEDNNHRTYYHGFTAESSIFRVGHITEHTGNASSHVLYVTLDGMYRPPGEVAICVSDAVDDGYCPTDGSYIWVSSADHETWSNYVPRDVTTIRLKIQTYIMEKVDLSFLNTAKSYSISLESTEWP